MNNYKHLCAVGVALALVTFACGVNIKSPITQIKTGPTQTVDIQVPLPQNPSNGVELTLEFLAGKLTLGPGASGNLASGTATYNAPDFEPKVETSGSSYTLRSGNMKIEGIPKVPDDFENEWDVQLANTPMSLNINAGAYTGNFELGGLSLQKLVISEGGSDLTASFSEANQVEMSSFTFSSGGSTLKLTGLANANFAQMNFTCGAGDYTLSFDGDLLRDADVKIDAGVGTVNVIVPEGVQAQLTYEGGLSSTNVSGGWVKNGDVYTLSGNGPAINILVKMGVGTLNLKTQ